MDPIDQAIIIFLSEDPDLTMKEIAEQVNLTQPSIGSRVRSLREQGFLQGSLSQCLKPRQETQGDV